MLTLEGYRATGGVQHGLGERAEAVYEALSDTGKAEAKKLFLRLIQPGEGTEDTRRRVALSELATEAEVVVGGDRAIRRRPAADDHHRRHDPGTLDRDLPRGGHHGLGPVRPMGRRGPCRSDHPPAPHGAAQEWERLDRSTDALYRGIPLAEATGWRDRAGDRLNGLESEFLDAGSALDRSTRHARRRRITTAFVALITALVVIAGVAVVGTNSGTALSGQLAAEANSALNVDPALESHARIEGHGRRAH